MGNVLSLLLGIMSDPDKKPDEIEVTTGDEALESGFGSELVGILGWVFLAFGALALLWAIYIGFVFATADDANKRAEAKKRLFNALSVMLIVVALTGILQLIKVGITSIDTKNNGTNVEIKEYSPTGTYKDAKLIIERNPASVGYSVIIPGTIVDDAGHGFGITDVTVTPVEQTVGGVKWTFNKNHMEIESPWAINGQVTTGLKDILCAFDATKNHSPFTLKFTMVYTQEGKKLTMPGQTCKTTWVCNKPYLQENFYKNLLGLIVETWYAVG